MFKRRAPLLASELNALLCQIGLSTLEVRPHLPAKGVLHFEQDSDGIATVLALLGDGRLGYFVRADIANSITVEGVTQCNCDGRQIITVEEPHIALPCLPGDDDSQFLTIAAMKNALPDSDRTLLDRVFGLYLSHTIHGLCDCRRPVMRRMWSLSAGLLQSLTDEIHDFLDIEPKVPQIRNVKTFVALASQLQSALRGNDTWIPLQRTIAELSLEDGCSVYLAESNGVLTKALCADSIRETSADCMLIREPHA